MEHEIQVSNDRNITCTCGKIFGNAEEVVTHNEVGTFSLSRKIHTHSYEYNKVLGNVEVCNVTVDECMVLPLSQSDKQWK